MLLINIYDLLRNPGYSPGKWRDWASGDMARDGWK